MNPIVKTCLIDSSRSAVENSEDPYFDENINSIYSSQSSSRGNLSPVPTPQLGKNMMRSIKDRDPYEVYDIAKLLGTGSMVRVLYV